MVGMRPGPEKNQEILKFRRPDAARNACKNDNHLSFRASAPATPPAATVAPIAPDRRLRRSRRTCEL